MTGYFAIALKGRMLEFVPETHTYLVDGVIVPSVTEILDKKFRSKYAGIDREVIRKAGERGTLIHDAIERYCKGQYSDIEEVRNFCFLEKKYGFEVVRNELPVLIDVGDITVAGRLDLALRMNGEDGGADIKTSSALDKEYVGYQLNLYRIGVRQSYDVDWKFLKAIHLRGETRKMIDIPINEELVTNYVKEYNDERCSDER